jgi:cytochrome c biogenesis protein CcmG/thiol:disulfide interchange protein DsbE
MPNRKIAQKNFSEEKLQKNDNISKIQISNFTPLLLFLLLIIFFALAIFNIQNLQSQNKKQESDSYLQEIFAHQKFPNVDKKYFISIETADFTLSQLDNKKNLVNRSNFIGKTIIVNFFASWCNSCRSEHQSLFKLQKDIKNNALLYGVTWQDIRKNTRKFINKEGNPFTDIFVDDNKNLSKYINLNAIPETIILNKEGRIIWHYKGELQDNIVDEIIKIVNFLNSL